MQYIQTESYMYVNVKFVYVEPPHFFSHKLDGRLKWDRAKDLKKENEPLFEKKNKNKRGIEGGRGKEGNPAASV